MFIIVLHDILRVQFLVMSCHLGGTLKGTSFVTLAYMRHLGIEGSVPLELSSQSK